MSTPIKQEEIDVELSLAEPYVPEGFDAYEWNELCDVIITVF